MTEYVNKQCRVEKITYVGKRETYDTLWAFVEVNSYDGISATFYAPADAFKVNDNVYVKIESIQ